jgi:hypothetical protein
VPGALDHDQIIDQALEVGRGEVRGACAPAHGDEKLCGLQVSAFQYLTILTACGRPSSCHSGRPQCRYIWLPAAEASQRRLPARGGDDWSDACV